MKRLIVPLTVFVLMVGAGAFSIAFLDWEPSYECVGEGQAGSGLLDEELGCEISQESFEENLNGDLGIRWNRLIGVLLILLAPAVSGTIWLVSHLRAKSKAKAAQAPITAY